MPPGEVEAPETFPQDNEKKSEKWRNGERILTVGIALAIAWFTYLQWGTQDRQANIASNQLALGNRQYDFTANEAQASDNAAAASLEVSKKVQVAEINQVAAMKQMAGAADRQAVAAAKQAAAASKQLALSQIPNIDIGMIVDLYDPDGESVAHAIISNGSPFPIRNALIAGGATPMPTSQIQIIWHHLRPPDRDDIVVGNPHTVALTSLRVNPAHRDDLISGRFSIVFAVELAFRDAAGRQQQRRRCMALSGPKEHPTRSYC